MKKTLKITSIAFVLLLLDLGLTTYFLYHYDGVVSEGNQLFYDSKYGYLVFVLNFVYLVLVFMASMMYTRYKTVILESNNPFSYVKKLYSSKHSLFIFVNLSFTFIVATFTSRLTVIFDWIIFGFYKHNFFDSKYAIIRSTMPMERFDLVTGLIAGFIAMPLWFRLEHLKSKKDVIYNHLMKVTIII